MMDEYEIHQFPDSGPPSRTGGTVEWAHSSDWWRVDGLLVNAELPGSSWIFALRQPEFSTGYVLEAELQTIGSIPSGGEHTFGLFAHADKGGYAAGVCYPAVPSDPRFAAIWMEQENPVATQEFDPALGWHTYRLEVRGKSIGFAIDGTLKLVVVPHLVPADVQVGIWSTAVHLAVRRAEVFALQPSLLVPYCG